MSCANAEKKQGSLLGEAGRLPEEELLKLDLEIFLNFKAEDRIMQWASITFQAPCQACPQSHPSPDREQCGRWLVEDLGCYFHGYLPLWWVSFFEPVLCSYTLLVQGPPSPVPRNLPEKTSPNPCFLPLPSAPPIHRSGKQGNKQHVSETWVQTPECWVNLGRAHPLSAC